ncbi:hypothetical protein ABUE34_00790 [Kozakia baliensis]|uniref:hypothetical protein n=1 Tax=Kozakia baliensis TaxID=153496 RepID=UPI00345BC65E
MADITNRVLHRLPVLAKQTEDHIGSIRGILKCNTEAAIKAAVFSLSFAAFKSLGRTGVALVAASAIECAEQYAATFGVKAAS